MMRKRTLMSDICDNKRRRLNYGENGTSDEPVPTDTKSALAHIASIFPTEKFTNRLPAIVMRHQIYAFIKCRTDVDKELNELRKKGEVRLFKLGEKDDQIGVVYSKDYKDYVDRVCRNSLKVDNFLRNVLAVCPDISYSNSVLKQEFGLHEDDIIELIQQGVLTCRDVGCYWLSIPRVGEFMKTFLYGRRAILQHVRRTKYKEILQNELEQRKLPKKALLGVLYHIYDIIGSDAVTPVETSSGIVLRLQPELIR
ncbi:serine/threonine-protein kinase 19-like [Argiope bruennichi]|uniref:Serine/threonine-protein kinase 19 like protein n=1 Tax=Argiope bruennichi TaxID=94029 RepID=A0A8T0EQM4_ARGBR|nr:serine/threonine-protein kinase 19-like [Argiope bruennichi]XP_055945206.1 serine/threonine-protein kinase 19-like [Argiope bruennichi]KAF8778213.1 Serine/threonine-protein kinase 19 like protein [Argiope bruennichi]